MTNNLIEVTPPTSHQPIISRWNRKHTWIAEWYYHWTRTVWETKDITIQNLLKDGVLQETEKIYKQMKSMILHQQLLCLDKSIEFDDKIDSTINECHIIKKNMEPFIINHVSKANYSSKTLS